jgi:hypothetical protein
MTIYFKKLSEAGKQRWNTTAVTHVKYGTVTDRNNLYLQVLPFTDKLTVRKQVISGNWKSVGTHSKNYAQRPINCNCPIGLNERMEALNKKFSEELIGLLSLHKSFIWSTWT